MRAAVYRSNADVRVEDLPEPRVGVGEFLLEVLACGVCGSDTMEWYRKPKAPLVLGHEAIGLVRDPAEGVPYREGERVFVSHHVPCMVCRACLRGKHTTCDTLHSTNLDPGGFAQRARVPAINVRHGVVRIPDGLSDEEATLLEPLACAVRGQRSTGLRPGDSVVVLGSGVAGLLNLRLARASGAGPILATDATPARLDAARRSGADEAVDARGDVPRAVRRLTGGHLADVVIAATGAEPALAQALQCVAPGGTVLWFAPSGPQTKLALPFNDLWKAQVTLTSTYAAAPQDLAVAHDLMRTRRVQVADLVTHVLPMKDAQRAFTLVAEARDALKVVLRPND